MKKIESLYIHYPFCKHLCNYCDFYKKVPQNKSVELNEYHQYLIQSFDNHEKMMKSNGYSWGHLKTIYIGGGTPSLWGIDGKNFLENFFKKNNLNFANEFTLEVNPGAWNEEILNEWEKIGVNRYSLGIQALNGTLSKFLDRVHSIEDVFETLEFFHKKNVNYSVDFMLGLPYSEEQKRDVIAELEEALKYNPSHFSVYILTVKENYKHFSKLPSEEWIEREYLQTAEFLKSKGFEHYEVSNFALAGKSSEHNLQYWKSKTVAALGPSATGFLTEERLRYKWKTNSPIFEIENLNESEFLLESIYMGLRSSIGLDLSKFSFEEQKMQALVNRWQQSGFAVVDQGQHLNLTSKGYLMLDSLMGELFAMNLIK